MNCTRLRNIFTIWMICHPLMTWAQETEVEQETKVEEATDPVAGHSYHGEAFNEGPRQSAVIMPNVGTVQFPTSTKKADAQHFMEQGVMQLHGFWYLEAERSFRQASMIDPNLAIAYWGMAMANQNNVTRSRGFINEALERLKTGADEREKLYIAALDQLIPKEAKDSDDEKSSQSDEREQKKQRAEKYISSMEKIIDQYPDDIEAKALIAVQMWTANGYGVKITSRYAVDALLSEVFEKNPSHPAHHYRIHLWDRNRPENALQAAAQCGPASPGIAHMWHMPGHIYSRLKRYQDAAWQQEASARVDHAHMIRTRLMPDEIHNFAHNNEWLVRNLIFVGRVREAIDLAKNLISLPQHPRFNSLEKRGSQKYGRQRLLQVLTEYELWDTLLEESEGPYLNETGNEEIDRERRAWIGVAHYMVGNREEGDSILETFQNEVDSFQKEIDQFTKKNEESKKGETDSSDDDSSKDAKDDSSENAEDEKKRQEEVKKKKQAREPLIARLQCALAVTEMNLEVFKTTEKKARLEATLKARWLARAGDRKEAIEIAKKQASNDTSQVRPLATLTQLLWEDDAKAEAAEQFEKLRKVAGNADWDTPFFTSLQPLAEIADAPADWRLPSEPAKDLGERPDLSELGPFRWTPYQVPDWQALDANANLIKGDGLDGKATIIIFYLGFGCLHCVEQLHTFSPMINQFEKAGINVIAISTENPQELKQGINDFEQEVPIPLLSDSERSVFKQFRCWDDFEDQPLHGTFLIDQEGRVRWQDISYEPFTDPEFLLKESSRLLQLP